MTGTLVSRGIEPVVGMFGQREPCIAKCLHPLPELGKYIRAILPKRGRHTVQNNIPMPGQDDRNRLNDTPCLRIAAAFVPRPRNIQPVSGDVVCRGSYQNRLLDFQSSTPRPPEYPLQTQHFIHPPLDSGFIGQIGSIRVGYVSLLDIGDSAEPTVIRDH